MRTAALMTVLALTGLIAFACKLRVVESSTLADASSRAQACTLVVSKVREDESNIEFAIGGITVASVPAIYRDSNAPRSNIDGLDKLAKAANNLKQAGICAF